MSTHVSRRSFLKGIAGITAAGILLPGEEQVRRFWRGWSAAPASAESLTGLPGLTISDPYAFLDRGDTVFLLEDRATGFGRMATWTGTAFIPSLITGYQKQVPLVRAPSTIFSLDTAPMEHGFTVIDVSNGISPSHGFLGLLANPHPRPTRENWDDSPLIQTRAPR